MGISKNIQDLDKEWVTLILAAKGLGLTSDKVKDFITEQQNKDIKVTPKDARSKYIRNYGL